MNKSTNSILKKGLTLVCCCMSFLSYSQDNVNIQITTVFNQLVLAYGNAKTPPELIIIDNKAKQMPPAKYYSNPKPNIKIDAYLFTICRTFGKDSLDALSIILSHELAHYYNDHTFCSDYAFAIKDKNTSLATDLKNASLNDKISKETEADLKGFFYAAAAGYHPFNLQNKLIDEIYKSYDLPNIQKGYPSKQERKIIANTAQEKAHVLYGHFQEGLKALNDKQYDKAISDFEKANSYIPYRENYNNIGVAKTLKALLLKVKTSEEYKYPDRFLYPIEVENQSRLAQETTRGMDDNDDEMEQLLKSAKNDFEKAIGLDPNFSKGYVNLACVYDLLDNPNAAIGTIKELPIAEQNTIEAQRILAIAYYHNDEEKKSEIIWLQLKM